ncbi:MAG: O-antigen ligase family protein [Nitrospiria bacterium]
MFLTGAVFLLILVLIYKRNEVLLVVLSVDGLFLVFISFATCSLFYSKNKPDSLMALLALWGSVSLGLVVRLFLKDIDSIEKIVKIILFSSLPVILYEFYQSIWQFGAIVTNVAHDESLKGLLEHFQFHRTPFSTFMTSNTLACYLVMIVPLIFYFLILESESKKKIKWIGLFSLVSMALFLTGSKGGVITYAVLVGTGLFFLFKLRKDSFSPVFKQILIAVSISIVLTFIFWRVEWKPVEQNTLKNEVAAFSMTSEKFESSAQGRLHYWSTAFNMWKSHWMIGSGIGTFPTLSPEYQKSAFYSKHAHNDYLEMLAEMGLTGAIFFSGFVLALFYQGVVIYQKIQNHPESLFLGMEKFRIILLEAALFLSLLGFLLHNAIDFNWEISANRTLFIIFLMMIVSLLGFVSEQISRHKKQNVYAVKIGNPFMIGLALGFLIIQGIWLPKITIAESYFNLATDPFETNLSKSIDFVQTAVEIFPYPSKYHLFLAGAYRARGIINHNMMDIDKAYLEGEAVLKLQPENPDAHAELAALLYAKGNMEESEKESGLAIEKAKEKISLYNQLGKTYLAEGNFQNARAILEKGLSHENNYREANHPDMFDVIDGHLLLAKAYETDSKDDAVREYEKALALLKAYPALNAVGHWNLLNPDYTLNLEAFARMKMESLSR